MFKKLRIKFVAVVMASVALVLAVVFTAICVSEYQREKGTVDSALDAAVQQAAEVGRRIGTGPFGPEVRALGLDGFDDDFFPEDGRQPASPEGYADGGAAGFGGPRIGGRGADAQATTPVAVYRFDEDGDLVAVGAVTTATMSDEVLAEVAEQLQGCSDGYGVLADLGLRYRVLASDSGTYAAFANASSLSGWQSLAARLAVAGAATLAVFFVIALFLSRWALRPVREAWDAQRQFVADASHELKTPLTVILANASILLKHPQDTIASQSQWVESIQTEANGMHELVNEMLQLAQVEEQVPVAHERLDFSDLAEGVVLQFESVAFENGCMLESSITPGICVEGDEARLRKLVSTLLENALKYVDAGGRVDVSLSTAGKRAELCIRNTGSVIAPEDLPHIFDRFYRTDKARTSGAGGFGLGLAIARGTAREHGGDIACTSSEAQGTAFTVSLPVA